MQPLGYESDSPTIRPRLTPIGRINTIQMYILPKFIYLFHTVTNPVYELPFIHHKRSLLHHIDSHTTQTVTLTLDFSSHNPLHSLYTLSQYTIYTFLWHKKPPRVNLTTLQAPYAMSLNLDFIIQHHSWAHCGFGCIQGTVL